MGTMNLLVVLAACGAAVLGCFAVIALQQDEHVRSGLLPGPDPRTGPGALLHSVLGAVPVRRVHRGSVEFEDGSGLLLDAPDPRGLAELSRLAAGREVLLEHVYELTVGWRLVFSDQAASALVDVRAFQVAATR